MEKFFISTPLGMEKHCLDELKEKWPLFNDTSLPECKLINSGIELELPLLDGLKLNYYMRSINRVLLRIKEQRCRDLPKLFKIISKLPWKDYLKHENAKFQVSAKESRLIHTGKIEKACKEGLEKYFNANKIKQKDLEKYKDDPLGQIYIRLNNDNLTISIDTTGELLYKREENIYKGIAPLRNNLAFIMLQFLKASIDQEIGQYNLIDPMCGSATFLKEARDYYIPIKRNFYFSHLLQELELKELQKSNFKAYYGFDLEKEIIEKATSDHISLKQQDIFKATKSELQKNACILNPPYGKKVKIEGGRDQFFNKLIKKIEDTYSPDILGIIIPEGVKIKKKPQKRLRIFNNGIWINFCLFEKNSN